MKRCDFWGGMLVNWISVKFHYMVLIRMEVSSGFKLHYHVVVKIAACAILDSNVVI